MKILYYFRKIIAILVIALFIGVACDVGSKGKKSGEEEKKIIDAQQKKIELLKKQLQEQKAKEKKQKAQKCFDDAIAFELREQKKKSWKSISAACALSDDEKYLICKARFLYKGFGTQKDEKAAKKIATKISDKLMANEDPFSLFMLGWMHENGVGVKKEKAKAITFYEKAEKKGYTHATCTLGFKYQQGDGVEQNFTTAFNLYDKAAKKDDPRGMMLQALLYYQGLGVAKDVQKALPLLQKVADRELPSGMFFLAQILLEQKKFSKAKKLLEQAAYLNHAESITSLAQMHYLGIGVDKSEEKAIKFLKKAISEGSTRAMKLLGDILFSKNTKEAIILYKKAAQQNNAEAMFSLGVIYFYGKGEKVNKNEGISFLIKATQKGHHQSMLCLGAMYQNGDGVEKNMAEALKWYQKASAYRNTDAMLAMGSVYHDGNGVKKDIKLAISWYEKAANLGHAKAMEILGAIYERGEAGKKDYRQAKRWYQRRVDLDGKGKKHIERIEKLLEGEKEYFPKNNGEVVAKYYIDWIFYILKIDISSAERNHLIQWVGRKMAAKISDISSMPKYQLEQQMAKNYNKTKFAQDREDSGKRRKLRQALDSDQVPIRISVIELELDRFRANNSSGADNLVGTTCYWDIKVDMYDRTPFGRLKVDETSFRIYAVIEKMLGNQYKVIVSKIQHTDRRNFGSYFYVQNIGAYKNAVIREYEGKTFVKIKNEVNLK